MKMRPVSAAILLLLSSMTFAVHADGVRRPYIVELTDKPIASYNGEVTGLNATQPAPGQRLDLDSSDVQLYNDYLGQKQATVQAAIAGAPVTHTYSVVLNGFAAMLTDDEVRALQARSDVAAVSADTPRSMVTSYTPAFLGLDKPDGLWSKLGGKTGAGENVIIGIVDGGVSPDNPAFADRVDANGRPTFDNSGTVAYSAAPASWKGICQIGEGFTLANCNNKLIGAQYFDATYLAQNKTTDWTEFKSPRDSLANAGWGGHGTHTASTAGGNAGVEAVMSNGVSLGSVSGMAPRARLATYKVCWSYLDAAQANGVRNACFTGDSVAAIEKSVKDGVNIINYSISGGGSVTDPVEQAFLNASNAGVFVAASAGNAGPANTVAHISPWLTTVAASTHNRTYVGDATLGDGQVLTGASNNAKTGVAPLVLAKDAGVAGLDAAATANLALCFGATDGSAALLDPAKISGKILVCDRGGNVLVNKSANALTAGAIGVIIANTPTSATTTLNAPHTIPTVHIAAAEGAKLKAYVAAAPGATAALGNVRAIADATVRAPVMASFSSRGPNMYDPNLLKPDLTAPGVDILAAHSPSQTQAEKADIVNGTRVPPAAFAPLQGTSMSSPHVAGLAALLRQLHPTWSPAAIKSALMTTGYNTLPDAIASGDTRGILPFAQGAGHVNPNSAADPGLVYDAKEADYRKYMCGAGVTTQCAGGTMLGYNLNMPSISVSNVLGSVVVNRSVTNVGASAATYNASISVPGYTAVVNPATLNLAVGETKPFTVTLTRTTSPTNVWQFGSLTWTDGSHVVRSPVVARSGAPVVAPGLITSTRSSLSKAIGVSTGFTGKMNTVYGGLKEISRTAYNVTQAASGSVETVAQIQAACRAAGPGVRVVPVTVPAGAVLAQFETFNRDTSSNGGDDLDMALLNGAGTVVATSLKAGSNESIVMPSPAAGNYQVCVIGYAAANNQSTDFTLSSAVVTSSDRGGNFRVLVPTKVYEGSTATVNASWSGLPAGKRYAGAMQLLNLTGGVATTTVFRVETDNPVPLAEAVERTQPQEAAL